MPYLKKLGTKQVLLSNERYSILDILYTCHILQTLACQSWHDRDRKNKQNQLVAVYPCQPRWHLFISRIETLDQSGCIFNPPNLFWYLSLPRIVMTPISSILLLSNKPFGCHFVSYHSIESYSTFSKYKAEFQLQQSQLHSIIPLIKLACIFRKVEPCAFKKYPFAVGD